MPFCETCGWLSLQEIWKQLVVEEEKAGLFILAAQ
jgi:hypothetical protein